MLGLCVGEMSPAFGELDISGPTRERPALYLNLLKNGVDELGEDPPQGLLIFDGDWVMVGNAFGEIGPPSTILLRPDESAFG
jgi:hypothetical protein